MKPVHNIWSDKDHIVIVDTMEESGKEVLVIAQVDIVQDYRQTLDLDIDDVILLIPDLFHCLEDAHKQEVMGQLKGLMQC